MSRPTNHTRRMNIHGRRAELRLENPLLTDTQINQMVAVENGVTIQTVWYYLRESKAVDSRVKYSAQEREKLCGMSRKQLLFYAAQNNKNFSTLYAMVRRHARNGIGYQARIEDHMDFCEEQDFMDFSRLVDLKAFSFPRDAFKEARKLVKEVNGLDLLPPNYLIHEHSRKFYALNLADQKELLVAPKRFLRENAGRITHNWKSYNPSGHYFVLINTQHEDKHFEGLTMSTHDTLTLAAQAAKAAARAKPPTPTKILRRIGESKSPFMRYVEGERIPKGGPDAGGCVIHVEGGDILDGNFAVGGPYWEPGTYREPPAVAGITVEAGDDYLTKDLPTTQAEEDDEPYDPYTCGVPEDDDLGLEGT